MAEWSNAAVLKTVDLHGSGGSNPSLSAKIKRSKEMSILSASFCFCSTTHTNLFVGRSDVKTKSGWFINSLRSADFCKEPAGKARERRVALALRCQSLIRSHKIFALLRFFCGVKRGIRSVGGVSGDLSACGCCLLSQIFVFVWWLSLKINFQPSSAKANNPRLQQPHFGHLSSAATVRVPCGREILLGRKGEWWLRRRLI